MAQKKHIEYASAKGAPAGFVLPGMIIAAESIQRAVLAVTASAAVDHLLDELTGLARVTAVGNGLFVRFQEGADKDDTKATGTLTLTGAIVPGKHAESVVTANTIVDGSQITIGDVTYTFKTALTTDPATVPNEVLIGAGDAEALDNLKSAINATAGEGTTYSTGTVAHPDVVATDNAATTQKVVARVPGTAVNSKATTSLDATLSWPAATLGDGTGASNPGVAPETVTIGAKTYSFVDVLSETNGAAAIANQVLFGANSAEALDNLKLAINGGATAGTNYSTGTVAHTQVTATTNSDTEQTVEAAQTGSSYNTVATTDTLSNGGWGAATLEGGNLMAFDAYIPAGETVDLPVEEDQTYLSFIADGGNATAVVIEF